MRASARRRMTSAITGALVLAALPLTSYASSTPGAAASADSAPASGGRVLLSDPFLQLPTEDAVRVVWNTEYRGSAHIALVGDGVAALTPLQAAQAARSGGSSDVRVIRADTARFSRLAEDHQSRLPAASVPSEAAGIVERPVWRHEAVVDGLERGTTAPYRVVSLDGDGYAASGTFSLAPLPVAGDGQRILLTSDHQAMANTPANLQEAASTIGDIDAVFLAGDMVNQPDRASEWFDDTRGSAFLATMQGHGGRLSTGGQEYDGAAIIQNAPLFPTIGNHEVQGRIDGKATIGASFEAAVPREIAEAEYARVAASVNPSGNKEVERRWIDDNSFSTTSYEEMFTLPDGSPGGETYYATTFGDVRLISLYSTRIWRSATANTGMGDDARVKSTRYQESEASLADPLEQGYGEHVFESLAEGSEQYEWLEDELASAEFEEARIRIVMLHEGPQGLGDNVMPHFTDPQRIEERDEGGQLVGVRYEYPAQEDMLLGDLMPLLEEAGVDLVHSGHSHLWNRFESPAGVDYLETSNTGNSYGAFHELSGRMRPLPPAPWDSSNYLAVGNPGGLEPVVPNVRPFLTPDGTPEPYVQSNDIAVFSVLDTTEGEVISYAYDVRTPGIAPWMIDEFAVGREDGSGAGPAPSPTPAPSSPPAPSASPSLPDGTPGEQKAAPLVSLSARAVPAGGRLSVGASGFTASRDARIELRSSPQLLASKSTDSDGSLSISVVVPAGTTTGRHRIVVTDAAGLSASASIDVTAEGSLPRTGSGPPAWVLATAAGLLLGSAAIALLSSRGRHRRGTVAGE